MVLLLDPEGEGQSAVKGGGLPGGELDCQQVHLQDLLAPASDAAVDDITPLRDSFGLQ